MAQIVMEFRDAEGTWATWRSKWHFQRWREGTMAMMVTLSLGPKAAIGRCDSKCFA